MELKCFRLNIGNLSIGLDIECSKWHGDFHRKIKQQEKFCKKHKPCERCPDYNVKCFVDYEDEKDIETIWDDEDGL